MIAILAHICIGVACHWVTVTTSEQDPEHVTMSGCLSAPPGLAEWMRQYPGYSLKGWRCVMGRRAVSL